MSEQSHLENEHISFLRKRDYRLVRELGQGACGKTVLLHDPLIDEHYVCKKYVPYSERYRSELFAAFVREVKLLYGVFHENVVRIYNHYLFPDACAGFILMEYVEGETIDRYVSKAPERINDLFHQAVAGFAYLQRNSILHRDIRTGNLMVSNGGRLKIIDLGFGKRIANKDDFDKSITLNWWCETPDEFRQSRYDFNTEVYFVGKLFEWLIQENNIQGFEETAVLGRMCRTDPAHRIASFVDVETEIRARKLPDIGFTEAELTIYRKFADAIWHPITKIESGTEFADDVQQVEASLNNAYHNFMLEEVVPDSAVVIGCFVRGSYYYKRNWGMFVETVRNFLQLLQSANLEKKRIIIANLHTRLNSLPRYKDSPEDDIPF